MGSYFFITISPCFVKLTYHSYQLDNFLEGFGELNCVLASSDEKATPILKTLLAIVIR